MQFAADDYSAVFSGEFSVYKKDEKGQDQLLFVYTTEGSAFGELSLMYGKPRAASIVAKTKGKLWSIGRTAFRAVIMKGRLEGLLQIYKTIPILAELSYPQLHRLCMASIEENYDKGEVVIDEEKAAKASCWALCVVMSGTIRCLTKEESKKRQIRSDMSYLLAAEVGTKFREVKADIRTRLTCIPKDIFMDIVNPDPEMELLLETPRKSGKGKRLQSLPSVFGLDNSQRLETIVDLDMITLEHPAVLIGDYAYIGNFKLPNDTNECRSLKVIAKQRAHKARMDAFLLQERQYLATLSSLIAVNRAVNDVRRSEKNADESAIDRNMNCIAEIIATTQDEKFAYLEYKEQFVCDLSLALSNNAIPEESKPLYLACIYSAISAVHMNGLLHRFINSNSFYITSSGIPKVIF